VSGEHPERFDLGSVDPTDDRVDALRATFPEVFREDRVDFDALRRALGDWVDPGPERFGLVWPGKAECMRVIQQPSIGTLVPMPEESVDWDTTQNVIIEGENLEVLKLLQKAYYGKVKLIYIDPPYNTGKEFIYPDNFREGLADYLRYSGQVDEEGFKLSANAETDGRYHSKWLSMMYPRLFLARNLLREDGVIIVSIADHEVAALRFLLSEIFGEENFIGTIVWKNVTDNNPSRIVAEHEYLMFYSRNAASSPAEWKSQVVPARERILEVETDLLARYKGEELQEQYAKWFRENKPFLKPMEGYKFIDDNGVFAGSRSVHNPGREGYRFDVTHPKTGVVCKAPLMGYRFPRDTLDKLLETGRIIFGEDETKLIELKVYASEFKMKLSSVHELDGRSGANRLRSLFPEAARVFTNPKPVDLLAEMFSYVLSSDDLVIDFFAGSGTTAEAVWALNLEDQGRRRVLLAQLPEPTGSEYFPSISTITRERMRRAGRQLDESNQGVGPFAVDCGFRAFRLAPSNFTIGYDGRRGSRGAAHHIGRSCRRRSDGAVDADRAIAQGGLPADVASYGGELRRHTRLLRRRGGAAGLPLERAVDRGVRGDGGAGAGDDPGTRRRVRRQRRAEGQRAADGQGTEPAGWE
jgi:adenine-specific DNA-methyltransferase